MIPNMFKIAGELLPVVFHVAARSVAAQALCIFGDHSDVMSTRSTGFVLMSSHSVQEAHDFAIISHMAALESSLPFCHFFDGFRTSHEIQKVKVATYDAIKELVPLERVNAFRARGLNPKSPHLKGTSQGPDIYFQNCEATNKYYDALPGIVERAMDAFAAKFGRQYRLVEYYGAPDADRVVVMMGAGAPICEEAVDYLAARGEKVGVVKVHLFRPFSARHLLAAIPATTRHITVLERTKEPGSQGEPLYTDVCAVFQEARDQWPVCPFIVGGRYGLGSKDFTPAMAKSVYDNMKSKAKNHFTVGINDDVTHTSLALGEEFDSVPEGTTQCMFWGLGSDGTVGANHDAIKIIGDNTDMFVQGYFAYDAHKSGGVTVSHLRFGKKPIKSQYLIKYADYVACHFTNYVNKYDMLAALKEGGTFVLNTPWTRAQIEESLPSFVKRAIALKKAQFYTVDAVSLAESVGLGRRINMVMQAVFFKLSGVLPYEQASQLLKKAIVKTYGSKGQKIVDMNHRAVDMAIERMSRVEYDAAAWSGLAAVRPKAAVQLKPAPQFVTDLLWPQLAMEGNALPVSAFAPGGVNPMGTTKYEKRGIAPSIPVWDSDKCMQCNECSFVCPHATIRPFVLTKDEAAKAPFKSVDANDAKGHMFRIQVSAEDCTGCEVCTTACMYGALSMKPLSTVQEVESRNWDYAVSLPNRGHMFKRETLVGSQFYQPLLEFSGACEGCNETAHVKLATQLFGERMVIANATGCSSIWGGTWGTIPYTVNERGHGPSWGNSLFEDGAEYGLGMAKANAASRQRLRTVVTAVLAESSCCPDELRTVLQRWTEHWLEGNVCEEVYAAVVPLLEKVKDKCDKCATMYGLRNYFPKLSQWIIGGDGWAYDIDYGGLDHVIASGVDLNVIVLDTEMYSNTGGQKSKATPMGAVAKFAADGCRANKKNLGMMAMAYQDIYVASVSLQANYDQCVRAMVEAESYPGCSLILCYCPCREQGFPLSQSLAEAKAAVDSGYWNLYRYDPRLMAEKKNPFQLDHPNASIELRKFLSRENRYESLMRTKKETATVLQTSLTETVAKRLERLRNLAADSVQVTPAAASATPAAAAPVKADPTKRVAAVTRAAAERMKDFNEVFPGYNKDQAAAEGKRCLNCKKPGCMEKCPQKLPIPRYIGAIAKGDFEGSLKIIMERMPLPSVCGRVCTHTCEANCVRAKRGDALAIHYLKRSASDFGASSIPALVPLKPATGKKIAVIGSGPSGLSAAYYLGLQGHKVVVFEQKKVLGGMLALCIPPFRLPQNMLQADIDRMRSIVEFRTERRVGVEGHETVQSLLNKDGFDAVFLAVGTLKPKKLGITGEDAAGVEHAITFLENVNINGKKDVGKKVAIIGGGFTALDAARTARRLGSEAIVIYRRAREQMPATVEEVRDAEEEGVKIELLTCPTKVLVKDGKVCGVECQKQKLGPADNSGRPTPQPIAGSEYVVDCDMLVQAISQEPDLSCFANLELKQTAWNTIAVDEKMATSVPRVWAAGDGVSGPRTVIEAIADAWKAAEHIDEFLRA